MFDDLLKHWTSGVQRTLDPDEEAARQMIANSAAGSSAANRFVSLLPPMAGGRPSPAPAPDGDTYSRQALTRMVGEPSAVRGMMGGAEYGEQYKPQADISGVLGGATGGVPYQVNVSPEANGSRPYDMFNTGLPQNPFYMGERPEAIHILGVNGFRTGSSRPVYDDAAGQAWDQRSRQNFMIQDMLGRQDIARQSNANDMMRTMMGVQQRSDAAKANSENRFLSILGKVPEGKKTPYIKEGMAAGHLDKTVGTDMLLNDMLTRAKQSAKTGSGIDLKRFLGTLSTEFNPNDLSRADLIQKIQQMGYTADQVDALKDDPQVGGFARSLLGPRERFETYGLSAIGHDASDRMKQLWGLISGR